MQNNQDSSGEDELIRLLLKRQSELNSLLEVTRAINKNTPTPTLIQMLEVILKNYLQVGKFRFLIEKNGAYSCISKYGGDIESPLTLNNTWVHLNKIKSPARLMDHTDKVLCQYNYFIPIYHKNKALAFALIGDFNTSGDMLNNDLNFIQTLINVIVVALENKKLFRERLQAERFQREMELAVEVQNMLIPLREHKEEGVEVGAKYLPHQDIGGDYFDFFRLNENEFLWCIADVSGKGISAALLMANFQASLHGLAAIEDELTTVVERLNKIVIRNTKGERFITLFLAKYNEKTRKLNYINAGHTPTILYSEGEAVPLKLGTTMIGAFEELPFLNEGEIDIEPGSLLFNYTDGLMDHESQNLKNWDEDKLLEFVIAHGELSPDGFNESLMNHINTVIKGKPIDDITLLTLRIS
ncbi:PP2C family protein-serine/threonine phosphatase [Mucilaginibacter sp.]|jgi:sigma-B regulation protein RsbU (phosphoserine phosphatase)|uniref:PP2C family protein-serine/threonine phosphatase n=1 Tax=Mucilaginibacter sp. TaxID=1882438 RepID=UPI002628E075|nr:PP2C family protein-serine/threonine phosphatase [Mucilaginibacter sp.]MDB5127888.1 serine/threonine protein phosphatase [Mucilaginibacter sp.]